MDVVVCCGRQCASPRPALGIERAARHRLSGLESLRVYDEWIESSSRAKREACVADYILASSQFKAVGTERVAVPILEPMSAARRPTRREQ